MEKAGVIVRDALAELMSSQPEQALKGVDFNTGVRYLNRMLDAWAAVGLDLGTSRVQFPDDYLEIPDAARAAVVFNLAIELANRFGYPISQSLSVVAANHYKAVVRLFPVKSSSFSGNLPRGSGNVLASESEFAFYPENGEIADSSSECCVDEIIQSATPPVNPKIGMLWLDTSKDLNPVDLEAQIKQLKSLNVPSLKSLPTAPQTDTVYSVIGFYAGSTIGGGKLVWRPSASKSLHNGVTYYSPEAIAAWNGTQADIATLLNWSGAGSGVFARVLGDFIAPEMAGAVGDGVAIDTRSLQAAIDVSANSTKTVLIDSSYKVSASSLAESFDNAGAAIPASDCAVVLRKGVSLVGSGRSEAKIFTDDAGLFIIAIIAPDSQSVSGMEIYSNWVAGNAGAGHGVFTLSTAGGADNSLRNLTIDDLYVHNVASYGISVQNGSPVGCVIRNCETYYTGADGFDLKARNDVSTLPESNVASGLTARRFNMRVDGSAGVDIRGVWSTESITVKDFGENAAKSYVGIRFRTKPPVSDPYNKAAAKSTLFSFNIKSDNVGECYGVQSGSDDVKISGGTIETVDYGVYLLGNANGSATRNTVHATTVIGATIQGFRNTSGVASCDFTSCYAVDCATGFRIEGVGTKIATCEANGASPLSISGGASPSTVVAPDCKFGSDSQLTFYRVAAGRVGVEAKGDATNIDIEFYPKGTGKMRFGTFTANADTPVVGYVDVKTLDGTVRKLAVIA